MGLPYIGDKKRPLRFSRSSAVRKINAYKSTVENSTYGQEKLFSNYVLYFPHIDPMISGLNTLETSHFVECGENASCHTEGNQNEKYREFHSCIVFIS